MDTRWNPEYTNALLANYNSWNLLPDDIVSASSLNIFKNKLDYNLWVNWGLTTKNKFF